MKKGKASLKETEHVAEQAAAGLGPGAGASPNPFIKTGVSGMMSLDDLRQQMIQQAQGVAEATANAVPTLREAQQTGLAEQRAAAGRAFTSSYGGAGGYGAVAGGAQTAALRQAALDASRQTADWNAQQSAGIAQAEIAAKQAALDASTFQAGLGTMQQERDQRHQLYMEDFLKLRELFADSKSSGEARQKTLDLLQMRLAAEPDPTLRAYWNQKLMDMGFASAGSLNTQVG